MAASPPAVMYLYPTMGGCTYWRAIAPAQALVAEGYPIRTFAATDVRAFEASIGIQAIVLTRLAWLPEDWLMAVRWIGELHQRGITVIYETDDDIFSEAWLHGQGPIMEPDKTLATLDADRQQRIKALRLCDGCLVTTPRLATLTREYTDKPVVVVPNAIDWPGWRAVWRQGKRPCADGVLIGWAGGKRDEADLAPLAAAWARVAAQCPEARFVVVGYHSPALISAVPQDRLYVADWVDVQLYPMIYAGWDIGCAPLEDKPFNHYKSPIKAFEYAAASAAVVASPPVYGQVLRPGIDGLLAKTADEWEAALVRLVRNAGQRRTLQHSWAKRVQEQYSLQVNLWRWPAAWLSIINQRRKVKAAV